MHVMSCQEARRSIRDGPEENDTLGDAQRACTVSARRINEGSICRRDVLRNRQRVIDWITQGGTYLLDRYFQYLRDGVFCMLSACQPPWRRLLSSERAGKLHISVSSSHGAQEGLVSGTGKHWKPPGEGSGRGGSRAILSDRPSPREVLGKARPCCAWPSCPL